MMMRFDAGTDIAMIGAWDGKRGASSLSNLSTKELDHAIRADTTEGHLFIVYTGGDGGGPLDLYVDEELPDEVREHVTEVRGEFLLRVPSGTLVVDGVEYYRSQSKPRSVSKAFVKAGDYALRCYVSEDEDKSPPNEEELINRVGEEGVRYYDRLNRVGCWSIVFVNVLLLGALTLWLGWGIAIGVTLVTLLLCVYAREYILKRNHKYQELNRIIPQIREAEERPTFVFALRSITEPNDLRGGYVEL